LASAKELRVFSGFSDGVIAVAFSPDGECALSGSWDGIVKSWKLS
jgi:WD40 repeat protein